MNRKELFDYATALKSNSSVQVLLANIMQTSLAADLAITSVKNVLMCRDASEGYSYDEAPNLVHFATDYERAQERLTGLFLCLAQTLQSQGHKIDF